MPKELMLTGNYPNPFNPETATRYALPQTGHVRLAVYDMTGRTVTVLIDSVRPQGAIACISRQESIDRHVHIPPDGKRRNEGAQDDASAIDHFNESCPLPHTLTKNGGAKCITYV